ncbi:MAG: TetR family transcriptional regulator [Rhodanobacter sp.]
MAKLRKTVTRAYAPEDKEIRQRALLQAAQQLFIAGDGALPAVSDIAAQAGLAKGTVYLYFKSREEIFATLAYEGWCEIIRDFELTLRSAKGSRATKSNTFWSAFARHFQARPELLRLDALGSVLEGKSGSPVLRGFKQSLTDKLLQCAAVLEEALGLPDGRGMQLLMRSFAMTRGLWQQFNQPYPAKPGVEAPLCFADELSEALSEYWRGALTTRK